MLTTRLTERFGLQHPILSAPMAGHSDGKLAAAVTNAGALGTFGASVAMTPDRVSDEIAVARSSTKGPIGVGFITQRLEAEQEQFEIALEAGLELLQFSFDDPTPWVARAKASGAAVACQVQTIAGAHEAVAAGADILIAQGREAGGHTAATSMLPLLDEVISAHPDVVVLAAGGIASGRMLAAVLAAGADGAVMGTRLLASPEAGIPDEQKQLLVDSTADDTVFTAVYDILGSGRWPRDVEARVLRNRFAAKWTGRERELEDRLAEVRERNAVDIQTDRWQNSAVYMGTGVSAIGAIEPVATVIERICNEAESLLSDRSR